MAIRWSIVLPYYNEAQFISATIASLQKQTLQPFQLIFVDNASTDGSTNIIKAIMADHNDIATRYVSESRPGKINALEAGLAHVDTEFVATCDADTVYPAHYLELCTAEFDRHGSSTVAMMALGLDGRPDSAAGRLKRWLYPTIIAPLLRHQCHTGGYGQAFRTAALKSAGGYGTERWHYVLEDHEVMHRIFRQGRSRYHRNLYCASSSRRIASAATRWSLYERLVYHLTPFQMKDWFFYTFLHGRFAERQMDGINLRLERPWE